MVDNRQEIRNYVVFSVAPGMESTEAARVKTGKPASLPERWIRIVCAVSVLACLAMMSACGDDSSPDSASTVEGSTRSSSAPSSAAQQVSTASSDIRIETAPVEMQGARTNLIGGVLSQDDQLKCLYLAADDGERMHLIFPAGAQVKSDPLRVVDAAGKTIGIVGQRVSFGGSVSDPEARDGGVDSCGATKAIYVWYLPTS